MGQPVAVDKIGKTEFGITLEEKAAMHTDMYSCQLVKLYILYAAEQEFLKEIRLLVDIMEAGKAAMLAARLGIQEVVAELHI